MRRAWTTRVHLSADDVVQAAKSSGVLVYSIGIGNPNSPAGLSIARFRCHQLPSDFGCDLLACISGLALAASFPSLNLDLLAWVAFIPLFWVIEDQPYVRVLL